MVLMIAQYIVYISLTPKSPDLLGEVQNLMISTRSMFLSLQGSISHGILARNTQFLTHADLFEIYFRCRRSGQKSACN